MVLKELVLGYLLGDSQGMDSDLFSNGSSSSSCDSRKSRSKESDWSFACPKTPSDSWLAVPLTHALASSSRPAMPTSIFEHSTGPSLRGLLATVCWHSTSMKSPNSRLKLHNYRPCHHLHSCSTLSYVQKWLKGVHGQIASEPSSMPVTDYESCAPITQFLAAAVSLQWSASA